MRSLILVILSSCRTSITLLHQNSHHLASGSCMNQQALRYPTKHLTYIKAFQLLLLLKLHPFSFQASDIIKLHESKCRNTERDRPVQISCDGVSECKSNLHSLDVYSVRFKNCRTVYPHTIIRPMPKYAVDSNKYLSNFISDMEINNCIIKAFIGDNPKRAKARAALHHASSFACEYCFSKASTFTIGQNQITIKKKDLEDQKMSVLNRIARLQEQETYDEEELNGLKLVLDNICNSLKEINKKKKQLVWPSNTMNGEPRTKEKILDIVRKIQSGEPLTKDEKKGIVGESPFLHLEYFDIVRDIPAEYLHCSCLGVVKRLLSLTFNVGINRPRITNRKLTSPSVFNSLMLNIKVVHEFSRRARCLDFSVLKGQEF